MRAGTRLLFELATTTAALTAETEYMTAVWGYNPELADFDVIRITASRGPTGLLYHKQDDAFH
jgi:hypothetical protein